jgi:hypothetical protein
MSSSVHIEFTEAEANAAVQLIDLAVKSGGMQVAEAGVIIVKKFQEAFKPVEEKPVSDKE